MDVLALEDAAWILAESMGLLQPFRCELSAPKIDCLPGVWLFYAQKR